MQIDKDFEDVRSYFSNGRIYLAGSPVPFARCRQRNGPSGRRLASSASFFFLSHDDDDDEAR